MLKKLLILTLTLAMSAFAVFGLTGCRDKNNDDDDGGSGNGGGSTIGCEHEYDDGQIVTKATVDTDGTKRYTCTKCGQKTTKSYVANSKLIKNFSESLVNIENGKGYNFTIKCEDAKMEGYPYNYDYNYDYDENLGYWVESYKTAVLDFTANANAEIYIGTDASGNLVANGYAKATVVADCDDFTKKFMNFDETAVFTIKNDVIYASVKLNNTFPALGNDYEGNYTEEEKFSISISELVEMGKEEFEDEFGLTFDSVMELINDKILPSISDFADNEIASLLDKVWSNVGDVLADNLVATVKQGFDTTNNNGYTLSLNLDKYKNLNESLYTDTVSEVYNAIYGANAFASLKADVLDLVDLKVEEIIDYVFSGTLTVERLVQELDAIAALIYPEEPNISFEYLTGIDIAEIINDPTLKAMTIGQIISEAAGVQVTELKTAIGAVFGSLETLTVYELINTYLIGEEDTAYITEIKDYISKGLEIANDVIDMEVNFDKNGKFQKATMSLVVNESIVNDAFADFGITDVPNGTVFSVLQTADVAITYELSIGSFKNKLGYDYDAFVANFNA